MMNWPTAFCLTFGTLFFLAFLLFLIVYLKELARENKIIKDYKQSLTMPLVFVDQPATKKAAKPKEPDPKDPKKNYN